MIRRVPCVTWPCRRCDRAGRSSWRSREAWHAKVRSRTEFGWWCFFAGWFFGGLLSVMWERHGWPYWLGIVLGFVVPLAAFAVIRWTVRRWER